MPRLIPPSDWAASRIELMKTSVGANRFYIMRDDMIPFSFGGSKCRIAASYFEDLQRGGYSSVISYGSGRSNLNRVVSHLAVSVGIPCTVVVPEPVADAERHLNYRLVKRMGARAVHCTRSSVRRTLHDLIEEANEKGERAYYVYGNELGIGNEVAAVRAYDRAFDDIRAFEAQSGVSLDLIFHASGTGLTQAGLIVGADRTGSSAVIVGISVARESAVGTAAVEQAVRSYAGTGSGPATRQVEFRDEYLSGGYGAYGSDIVDTIDTVLRADGIALDPTYTGKAFLGMRRYLEKRNIRARDVLFVHTGGLPNFIDSVAG